MGPWDLHLTAQEFILQHFEQVTSYVVINVTSDQSSPGTRPQVSF